MTEEEIDMACLLRPRPVPSYVTHSSVSCNCAEDVEVTYPPDRYEMTSANKLSYMFQEVPCEDAVSHGWVKDHNGKLWCPGRVNGMGDPVPSCENGCKFYFDHYSRFWDIRERPMFKWFDSKELTDENGEIPEMIFVPERTCHMYWDSLLEAWSCSSCGILPYWAEIAWDDFHAGNEETREDMKFRFCPVCGAKVVGE